MKKTAFPILVLAVVSTLVMTGIAGAWAPGHHTTIDDRAFWNQAIPAPWTRSAIANAADDPDGLSLCYPHTPVWPANNLQNCTRDYAIPSGKTGTRVNATEFGYATHFLGDAGMPYHAAGDILNLNNHYAFEWYAETYQSLNCNSVQSAISNGARIDVPNTGNLGADIVSHVNNLVNSASPQFSALNTLVGRGYLDLSSGGSYVMVCGNAVWLGQRGIDENRLTATERTNLQNTTRNLLITTGRYEMGLLYLEGPGRRQPNID